MADSSKAKLEPLDLQEPAPKVCFSPLQKKNLRNPSLTNILGGANAGGSVGGGLSGMFSDLRSLKCESIVSDVSSRWCWNRRPGWCWRRRWSLWYVQNALFNLVKNFLTHSLL